MSLDDPSSEDALAETVLGPDATAESADDSILRAALGMGARRPPVAVAAGQVIDEAYRVERELGAGGMGVVYLARDLRLDREVAIKLHATAAGERLLREAQAMAQLTHPNVATVYEVGTWTGHPYVAMEYVDGGTARTWRAAAPRTQREVLDLYLAAGRGLAAAHARGLVHRDFKPDNVLVGKDGRIRVADFGLARGPAATGTTGGDAPASTLTATGAVMGTPAYMAPEQRTPGAEVGPAADQFAFAVALWEALGGKRPFTGETTEAIAASIASGDRRAPAADRRVRAALSRALAADPAARWPSMDALLAALAPRRQYLGVVAAIAALALLGGAVGLQLGRGNGVPPRGTPGASPCADAGEGLAGTWDDDRHAALRAAFAGAEETFDRVAARLDAHAAGWRAQRIEACEATRVRGDQSAALLDLRNHCLDRRKGELGALVGVLEREGAAIADRAIDATLRLGDLAECADVPRLTGQPRAPGAPDAESAIAEAIVLHAAGRGDAALAAAHRAVAAADAAGDLGLGAEARYWLGFALSATGDRASVRDALEEGARLAARAGDDHRAADIWVAVLQTVIVDLAQLEEAEKLLPVAESAVLRAGSPPAVEALLASAVGDLRLRQGRLDDARTSLERALALQETAHGADSPKLANTLNRLGSVLRGLGELDAALAALERAERILVATYGPMHPHVGATVTNLGNAHVAGGDPEKGRVTLERALAIKEATLGEEHPDLASTLANLSAALVALGRFEDAAPHAARAVALVEGKLGRDHPSTALALSMQADVLIGLGDAVGARAALVRALAIQEPALGKDAPATVETRVALEQLARAARRSRGR